MRVSIYSRGRNRWQIDVEAEPDPETGRRRRVYKIVRGTKADAQAEAARIVAELERGTYVDPDTLSTAEYLRQWLEAAARRLAPSTLSVTRYIVERHLIPGLGRVPLQRLRPLHIERLAARLDDQGYAPEYRAKILKILRRALRQAVRWQLLAVNPAEAVQASRGRERRMRCLTREEAQRLLDAAKARPLVYRAIAFALQTGLRRGELLGLRWEDVDWEQRLVRVQRALQHVPGQGLRFVEPKTATSRRSVALGASTLALLREHRREQLEARLRLGPAYEDHGLVFAREDGRPWSPDALDRAFRLACRRAGLEAVRVHDLRHTHATWLLEAGVHPRVVQERLGHSSVTLTLDLYSHVMPTLQRDAADRMERLFGLAVGDLSENFPTYAIRSASETRKAGARSPGLDVSAVKRSARNA